MTKSTPDVSTCFVFKSSPEAFISPLFFKNYFTLAPLPQTFPRSGAMTPHIIWLALGFLPSYAPDLYVQVTVTKTPSYHSDLIFWSTKKSSPAP